MDFNQREKKRVPVAWFNPCQAREKSRDSNFVSNFEVDNCDFRSDWVIGSCKSFMLIPANAANANTFLVWSSLQIPTNICGDENDKQNPHRMRCTSLGQDPVWQRNQVTLTATKQNGKISS